MTMAKQLPHDVTFGVEPSHIWLPRYWSMRWEGQEVWVRWAEIVMSHVLSAPLSAEVQIEAVDQVWKILFQTRTGSRSGGVPEQVAPLFSQLREQLTSRGVIVRMYSLRSEPPIDAGPPQDMDWPGDGWPYELVDWRMPQKRPVQEPLSALCASVLDAFQNV